MWTFCLRLWKTRAIVSPPEEKPTPLYDDVVPQQQEQELELNTNVAYGTTCTSIGAVQ